MRARTSALVTLAAAAVAVGIAVPALATSGTPAGERPRGHAGIRAVRRRLEPPADHDPRHARAPSPPPCIRPAASPCSRPPSTTPSSRSPRRRAVRGDRARRGRRPAGRRRRPGRARRPRRALPAEARRPGRAAARPSWSASPKGRRSRTASRSAAAAAQRSSDARRDGSAAAPPFTAGTRPATTGRRHRSRPPRCTPAGARSRRSCWPADSSSARPHPRGHERRVRDGARRGGTVGRDSSTTRTADQTVAGKFWSASPIWNTWNEIAQQLVTDGTPGWPRRTAASRRMDLALADTTIAMYDAKYADHVWRPVTAIPAASEEPQPTDWNPLTPTAADRPTRARTVR